MSTDRIPGEQSSDKFYRERILTIAPINDHLFTFRLSRSPGFRFIPGQFARLGLYRGDAPLGPRYVWRAYSVVSSPYDEALEFYSIVVPDGEFTTRLAALHCGDEVLVERSANGFLTLDRFEGGSTLWLLSSGTGLAPFMSILHDLATWERFTQIVLVHSVRYEIELAYRAQLHALAQTPHLAEYFLHHGCQFVYLPVVTRERCPGIAHSRLPALISTGELDTLAGVPLSTRDSRIMICGNPTMVEDVRASLLDRGMTMTRRAAPGNIAIENYW